MKFKIIKWGLIIVVLAGGAVLIFQNADKFSGLSVSAKESIKLVDTSISGNLATPAKGDIGLPVSILIPSIKVNAAIDAVGLLPDGSMGVPKIPSKAAWFELGPRPGEVGSAVISGHVNWWNGATGSFAKLNKLKPGDRVSVKDDKGQIISFIVRQSREYLSNEDATNVFFSNDGQAHLNLITCAGVWNKSAKQYTKRLVIFTDRE